MEELKPEITGDELAAMTLCVKAHEGQTDKAGVAYYTHPFRVADSFPKESTERIVGYLHDVIEDTETTLDEIEKQFGSIVASQVDLLTRRKDEDYASYIESIKDSPIAKAVKIADLRDKLSLGRAHLSDSLIRRYARSLYELTKVVDDEPL